jgi:hypothetical protein
VASGESIHRFSIECAVWHPSISAEEISELVGLTPRIQWSLGDVNRTTGNNYDRTYCRFALGQYSQKQINNGLKTLARFRSLSSKSMFHESGGIIIVYFKNLDAAPELHIDQLGLAAISDIKSSIVFR